MAAKSLRRWSVGFDVLGVPRLRDERRKRRWWSAMCSVRRVVKDLVEAVSSWLACAW